ncbi:hypothetical protein [Flavobacterium sp.]|uniref:hypothetical protein n=1 Tax=Flavobacterium sp. TaxID=239 RepID=UPI00375095BD
MRNLKFILAVFIVFLSLETSAQVSINLNIGGRPDWCNNYDDDVEYVYLPEIECYYDMHSSVYIYYGPRGWMRSRNLPEYCHNYDMNRGYRVVLDYRGRSPYANFENHRSRYYRDCHRNYREEYYGNNNYNRRSNAVAVVYNDNHRYNDNDDDNYYYKKEKKHKNHDNDDHENGRGQGRGRR